MQLTSTQKRTAAWCPIAAPVMLALWLLGPVLTPRRMPTSNMVSKLCQG